MNNLDTIVSLMIEAFTNDLKFEMPVKGTSMLPLLKTGDIVLLEDIKKSGLKKRDVIFYQRKNGQYVLHRIYKIKKDYLIVLGDNQLEKEKLEKKLVIAKMVGYTKNNKYIQVKSLKYRFYSFIWNIYWFRLLVLKAKWRLSKRSKKQQ